MCRLLSGSYKFSISNLWSCLLSTRELVNYNEIQYIPRNMHTVFALLCFVVVIHWLIFPYLSGLLHWHCGNLTIAPVPAKQPWWIWINTSCEFIMNDCITTTKQSTTKPCAYFLGYTVLLCYCRLSLYPVVTFWRCMVQPKDMIYVPIIDSNMKLYVKLHYATLLSERITLEKNRRLISTEYHV